MSTCGKMFSPVLEVIGETQIMSGGCFASDGGIKLFPGKMSKASTEKSKSSLTIQQLLESQRICGEYFHD